MGVRPFFRWPSSWSLKNCGGKGAKGAREGVGGGWVGEGRIAAGSSRRQGGETTGGMRQGLPGRAKACAGAVLPGCTTPLLSQQPPRRHSTPPQPSPPSPCHQWEA